VGTPGRSFQMLRGLFALCLMSGANGMAGAAATDGSIVCALRPSGSWAADGNGGLLMPPAVPDSAPLVRLYPEGGTVDTLAFVRSVRTRMALAEYEPGSIAVTPLINPVPVVDECAVLPDGTVVVVRGSDYRLDRLDSDGAIVSSIQIPYERIRLSAADRNRLVDSVAYALMLRQGFGGARVVPTLRDPRTAPLPLADIHSLTFIGWDAATDPDGLARPDRPRLAPLFVLPAEELPDELPPFRAGGVRVDAAGNLWIHTWAAGTGGAIYDVISGSGRRLDRVELPPAHTVVGFGRGGAVYLAGTETGVARLTRFRWSAPRP
jgi:hypothetical protein